MRIIDVSMFFNEVQLLEIRLSALIDQVDLFIVVESNQTFTGKFKEHILPQLSYLKAKYGKKLLFLSRNEMFLDYKDILTKLKSKNSNFTIEETKHLIKILKSHNHYDKSKINLLLDSFQREACSIYIQRYCNKEDLVIFSDADELPDNLNDINNYFLNKKLKPVSLLQHEFWYYPNIFHASTWEGSVAGYAHDFMVNSLNNFRIKNKSKRLNTITLSTFNGYHLTSMGGVEMLKKKIKNWTHQEFNNFHILNSLEDKIIAGEDIFMRTTGTVTRLVKLQEFYSDHYRKAIMNNSIPMANDLKNKKNNKFKKFFNKLILKIVNLLKSN